MAAESVHRLFTPLAIHFNEAIAIACVGLLVNLGCAVLLGDHDHKGGDGGAHRQDLNLRAAYLHVLADAFTSVLAITALTGGKFFGWAWLDPVVGIVGSGVVFSWAYSLVRDTSGILLDRTPPSSDLPDQIRRAVESDGDSLVTDLHVWQVGIGKFAAMISIVAHQPKELGLLSRVASRARRTRSRHHRDTALPRRTSRGCGTGQLLNDRSTLAGRRGLCFRPCRWIHWHIAPFGAQAALCADQFGGRNASGSNALCDCTGKPGRH